MARLSKKKCPYYGGYKGESSYVAIPQGAHHCDLYEPKRKNNIQCKKYPCVRCATINTKTGELEVT